MFVGNTRVNHFFLCMDGKRRRCKGCHVFGICKEVVIWCITCNNHLCKTYLAGHWAKKKKMKSKMWFNVMKFLWLLLAFNPLYLIYIPNVVKYVCDDLNTNFNKLYNLSIVLLISLMKPRVLCQCSLFSSLFTYFIFTFINFYSGFI